MHLLTESMEVIKVRGRVLFFFPLNHIIVCLSDFKDAMEDGVNTPRMTALQTKRSSYGR